MPFAASPSVGKMPNPLYPFDARLVSSWFCRSCFQSVGTSKLPLVSLKSVAASAMAERMGSKYGCGPPGTIATVAAVVPPPPPWLPPHEVSTKSARMDTASLLPVTTYLLVVKVYWKCQYPIVYLGLETESPRSGAPGRRDREPLQAARSTAPSALGSAAPVLRD